MRDKDLFDRQFDNTRRLAIGIIVFNAVLTLATLGGIVFVIYKVLAYFGIL